MSNPFMEFDLGDFSNTNIAQLSLAEIRRDSYTEGFIKGKEQGRADAIETVEEFIRECKINKAMDKSCDECKYSHHSYHQTCLEYVLEQLKEKKND